MAEKCPLMGMVWDGEIPEVCRTRCEDLWDAQIADPRVVPEIDYFDHDEEGQCGGTEIEHGGSSLQVTSRYGRVYGILSSCVSCGGDVFANEYTFACPLPASTK